MDNKPLDTQLADTFIPRALKMFKKGRSKPHMLPSPLQIAPNCGGTVHVRFDTSFFLSLSFKTRIVGNLFSPSAVTVIVCLFFD